MANLSSLAPITTTATALSNLILVSPQTTVGYQPQNPPTQDGSTPPKLPAILFHYEGEQSSIIESDITDHYIEDNTAIEDQIALRPERITTQGFIGELNDIAPVAAGTFQQLLTKLTVIGAYAPQLTKTALIAYDEAFLLYQTAANAVNSAVSAYSSINGTNGENVIGSNGLGSAFNAQTGTISGNQSKQQVAYQQFYGYWKSRTLFTVQTPWAIFRNMAIESMRAIQDEKTTVISDFEITFKMIRFASTVNETEQAFNQGRLSNQASPVSDNGTSTPASSVTPAAALTSNFPGSFPGLAA